MTELSHHIFPHRVCFFIYKDAIFKQERSQEEGKERGFIYVYEQNIIKPNTVGWHCDEQTIICRQLWWDLGCTSRLSLEEVICFIWVLNDLNIKEQ